MNIVNLTPHALNIYPSENSIGSTHNLSVEIPPSGKISRLKEFETRLDDIEDFAIRKITYHEVINLPEPQENTIFIVSGRMLDIINRKDVFAPGPAIRDDSGKIIGCDGFSCSEEYLKEHEKETQI